MKKSNTLSHRCFHIWQAMALWSVLVPFQANSQPAITADQIGITGNLGGTIPSVSGNVRFGWNYTSGQAEADFFNSFTQVSGLPINSFCWYQLTSPSAAQNLMCLGPDGRLKVGATGWLDVSIGNIESIGQLVSLSKIGGVAGLFASRSSDSGVVGGENVVGVESYALNNNSTQVQTVYAGYFESRRSPGAGITHGIEVGLVNSGSAVEVSPYNMFSTGLTAAYWASSGRTDVPTSGSVSVGLGIIAGPAKFLTGVAFQDQALAVNSTGRMVAIDMAREHTILWRESTSGSTAAFVTSLVSKPSGQGIAFSDDGIQLVTQNASTAMTIADGSVTTASLRVAGRILLADCPSSPTNLPSGTLWCNGNVVNRVP